MTYVGAAMRRRVRTSTGQNDPSGPASLQDTVRIIRGRR